MPEGWVWVERPRHPVISKSYKQGDFDMSERVLLAAKRIRAIRGYIFGSNHPYAYVEVAFEVTDVAGRQREIVAD
jgi:hypothetical protein